MSRDGVKEMARRMFEKMVAAGWVKIPPGWTLVPDHPTPEQLHAAVEATKPMLFRGDVEGVAAIYYAAVKAAPPFRSLFEKATFDD